MAAPDGLVRAMFLCTRNSWRSQMAEGWTRALHADTIDACSAGVAPQRLDRLGVAAMAEAGIDIGAQRSKPIDACDPDTLELVVTVCDDARESCPVFRGRARIIHHAFDDPPRLAAGATTDDEALPHYRRVRDEIRSFVERLPRILREAGIDIPTHEVTHGT